MVFENKNREYGSYSLQKKAQRYLFIGFLISLVGVSSGIAVPLISAYRNKDKKVLLANETVAELRNLSAEDNAPPPPPPAPPALLEQQYKYTAPVVVDTVTEDAALAIVDDIKDVALNEPVPETIEVVEEAESVIPDDEPALTFVEEQATFQGGDISSFQAWVQKNLVYPPIAVENGIFGKVIVQFVVNTRGDVTDVKILRGVDPSLDNETVRVIMSSPKWGAARQAGHPAKQQFIIPVIFTFE